MGQLVNNWVITKGLGVYGTDYTKRAVVAAYGWPANLQADAVYPYTELDSSGQKLTGTNKYTLTFAKERRHRTRFWSITMYEIDQGWWFVPNALNKFTVSPRDNLKANADGSITLYFQNESPGLDKEANWLPAPKGEFIPMLRMYWPMQTSPSILNGSWTPPAVQRIEQGVGTRLAVTTVARLRPTHPSRCHPEFRESEIPGTQGPHSVRLPHWVPALRAFALRPG
jgi:hypothetical protein